MGKKTKIKSQKIQNAIHNHSTSNMITEQQQKMLYSTKRHTQQGTRHHVNQKKPSNQPNDIEDQEDDQMQQIELSNLNHTSAEEITEFINKLIAKNKISSKNAFDIPLIHLEQMEDFRASLNDNTWKRLSSTLENDYKIYGYRVDATHTITYKMVESIARHEATAEETMERTNEFLSKPVQSKKGSNQNDLLESFIDNELNENVNKNKLNVDYTKFIEKNQKLLNIGQIESFFGYNPGLERTKRKFDQQGFRSLLLNNIELRNGCELKLDEHYYNENEQGPKEQMQENCMIKGNEKMNQDQFDEMMNMITDKNENLIFPESSEKQKSIFTEIYELNVNEGKTQGSDFAEFERLYRIVSKEDKEDRKLKKKPLPIIEEKNENESKNVEKLQNLSNQQGIPNEQQNNLPDNQQPQPINQSINQQIPIVSNSDQVQNSHHISQDEQKINNKEHPQTMNIQNQPIQSVFQQLHDSVQLPKEEVEHVLANKNFQMRELNLDKLDQESQSSLSNQPEKIQYTGKLKNIEEYIKIKQTSRKDKKTKINIDQLDPDQIGKILFNKKYTKKKPQKNIKIQHLLKDQSASNQNKKIDFNKLKKQNHDLKRSLIFKKSLTQEKIFTHTQQKIQQKLQQREKINNASKQAEMQTKKKGKKFSRLFDLPIYQFQQGDINFTSSFEEIDPQTSELEFSDIFKNHFPSFVFSSNQILEEIRQKNDLKQKQRLQKQRQIEQKKRLEEGNLLGAIEQEHNLANEVSENIIEEQNVLQNSDNNSPDISFIYDEIGQVKGNQVIIRQAKEKVKKLMLRMFKDVKAKNNAPQKKHKPKKLTYKNIYEAYYRQNGYISPALCFLTILHLANQHNLILEGKQDGSNFKIWAEEGNKISQEFDAQEELNQSKIQIEYSFISRDESSHSSVRTQNGKILKDLSRSENN